MFVKPLRVKSHSSGNVIKNEENKVIVSVKPGILLFKKGQKVRVVSKDECITALGKKGSVIEVIAQGIISDVNKNQITISAKRSNPIISKKAISNDKEVIVHIVE